jgi:hypothetical protein
MSTPDSSPTPNSQNIAEPLPSSPRLVRLNSNDPPHDPVADALAPIMFWLSVCFLGLIACVMVLWVDVPRLADATEERGGTDSSTGTPHHPALEFDSFSLNSVALGHTVVRLLFALWPVFLLEQLALFLLTKPGESFYQRHRYWWAFCLFPPLRMCARHHGSRDRIWLPKLGWQAVNHNLQRQLERAFSLPMIGIALLILPVLALQAIFQDNMAHFPALRITLHISTGVIWFAFAAEFLVMVSVASRKLDYCRRHWLDLVIIALPLISFLRSVRMLRATKLLNMSKLQQLSKIVRVYRLRGVALRGWRALLLLELVDRLLHATPEKRIRRLEARCEQAEREWLQLRAELEERRAQLQRTQSQPQNQPDFRSDQQLPSQ